jgi:hypothetical protein
MVSIREMRNTEERSLTVSIRPGSVSMLGDMCIGITGGLWNSKSVVGRESQSLIDRLWWDPSNIYETVRWE